jgi:Ca-activated chloride channel family protein
MKLGTELYDALEPPEPSERERRIIFLTDAMPNIGETSEGGLLGMARANAARGIHATFIGIGVDFNTELVEAITKVRGANYHSVHSAKEFKERMDEGFDYMVTPLVFDLRLRLESPGWSIEKVFGSPEADEATGELMHVNTLFPSKREGGETRGGLVLLKLRRTAPEGGAIRLVAAYEDRAGAAGSSEAAVTVPAEGPEGADNAGVRKGVLLARYASLLKDWLRDERAAPGPAPPVYTVTRETGIVVPREGPEEGLGRWERRSEPLRVSAHYRELFGAFRDHLKAEMDAIGDATLARELEVLDKLRTPGGGG